jgi:hypothetical protein
MDIIWASGHYPDGLNEPAIDRLMAEVDGLLARGPRPSLALVNGTAAERARRRRDRHTVRFVVRRLPVVQQHAGSDEGEAA